MMRSRVSLTEVADFWDAASCGEVYAVGRSRAEQFAAQAKVRYELEPFIAEFARFGEARNKDVLEIGVGMGADHLEWSKAEPRTLTGLDLTPRALAFTQERLSLHGRRTRLAAADAEHLPFPDASFDIVYSWGVLHHAPDTAAALREVHRVLRPGGSARLMLYHRNSIVGYVLWLRYALLTGKPQLTLADIYDTRLESPGTKAFTRAEALDICAAFSAVRTSVRLSAGDLMLGAAGQRHGGPLLTLARRIWPRWFIARVLHSHGLFMMIDADR